SCAVGPSANPTFPPDVSPTPLPQPAYVGIGRYVKLAETTVGQSFGGVPFVAFTEIDQVPDSTLTQSNVGGFVYALKGSHYVYWDDGEHRKSWDEGAADWVNPGVSHVNLTQSQSTWYFITFRPVADRSSAP